MSGLGGADDTPVCLTFIQDEYFGSYTENNVRVSSTLRLFCIIADRCQVSGIRCSILPKLAVSPLLPPVVKVECDKARAVRVLSSQYCGRILQVVVCCGVVRTAAVVGLRLVLREGLHSSSCCSKRPQQQSMPAITPAADVFAIVTVVREISSLLHLN